MELKYFIVLFPLLFISCNFIAQEQLNQSTIDEYYGVTVEDPYRSMENLEDSIVLKWFQRQGHQARSILEQISGRDHLIELQARLLNPDLENIKSIKITQKGQLFYLKRKSNEDYPKLYYRSSQQSKEELLFDSKNYSPKSGKQYYINYISPNWDGTKVVISFAKSGDEFSEMRIFDLTTRGLLPIIIKDCIPTFFNVYWLPDNSGITYLRFQIAKGGKEAYLNTEAVIHKFNQSPRVVFSKASNLDIDIKSADFPVLVVNHPQDRFIIAAVAGATPYFDSYYIPSNQIIKDKPNWKPLFKKEDQTRIFFQNQDSIIYLTSKNTSNFKICKTSLINPDFKNPITVVEEKKDEVIKSFRLMKNGIVYTTTKNGVEAKLYFRDNKGVHNEISLPFAAGKVILQIKNKTEDHLVIRAKGWLHREQRYTYDFTDKKFIEANLSPQQNSNNIKDIMVEERLVTAKDGEEIPLSLIYDKNIKKDGNNPVFMIGYGAYGRSIEPGFSEKITSWAIEGGVFAIAHVRGGGEKGDAWYRGGFKETKPNTWKDLISCTEYLIQNRYTSSKKIAIHGASAGGITVGRAMTERPDLFAAVIASVGVMNTVRAETGFNGENNAKEFGTIKNEKEFKGLLEMDSYHNIKKGVSYPATLVTTGMNDSRVAPWHSAKFVAKLQEYNSSENPILFDVDYGSGHNSSDSRKTRIKSVTDVLSFAFWQTGHPKYQLKDQE
ncbi:prolyl oligopeptidase family serine peptidase [Aquimarina algiphila]|uniref:prolyl oligopeptidase family serine peptidase n=1 Tax=Aquimarina algiphila TaxID=2047982 RepID=UPI00232E0D8E|nr:prolyl oligopeptidase family serine peptidase [Aquimarina algiphila]